MKIILDIPDTTICAFFDFVRYENAFDGMTMQGHSISSDELYDGSEIKIKSVTKEEQSERRSYYYINDLCYNNSDYMDW